MAEVEFVVLGFVVMASVEGNAKGPQAISQRYTSRAAAEGYRDLAIKQGFADAYVAEVTGLESNKKPPRGAKRREILPPSK